MSESGKTQWATKIYGRLQRKDEWHRASPEDAINARVPDVRKLLDNSSTLPLHYFAFDGNQWHHGCLTQASAVITDAQAQELADKFSVVKDLDINVYTTGNYESAIRGMRTYYKKELESGKEQDAASAPIPDTPDKVRKYIDKDGEYSVGGRPLQLWLGYVSKPGASLPEHVGDLNSDTMQQSFSEYVLPQYLNEEVCKFTPYEERSTPIAGVLGEAAVEHLKDKTRDGKPVVITYDPQAKTFQDVTSTLRYDRDWLKQQEKTSSERRDSSARADSQTTEKKDAAQSTGSDAAIGAATGFAAAIAAAKKFTTDLSPGAKAATIAGITVAAAGAGYWASRHMRQKQQQQAPDGPKR